MSYTFKNRSEGNILSLEVGQVLDKAILCHCSSLCVCIFMQTKHKCTVNLLCAGIKPQEVVELGELQRCTMPRKCVRETPRRSHNPSLVSATKGKVRRNEHRDMGKMARVHGISDHVVKHMGGGGDKSRAGCRCPGTQKEERLAWAKLLFKHCAHLQQQENFVADDVPNSRNTHYVSAKAAKDGP